MHLFILYNDNFSNLLTSLKVKTQLSVSHWNNLKQNLNIDSNLNRLSCSTAENRCCRWSSIDKVKEKPWTAVLFHSPNLISSTLKRRKCEFPTSLFFPSFRSHRLCRSDYETKQDQYYWKNGSNKIYAPIRGECFVQA